MEPKEIACECCQQTHDIIYNFATGMWELLIGPISISHLSWTDLKDRWLEYHMHECRGNLPAESSIGYKESPAAGLQM